MIRKTHCALLSVVLGMGSWAWAQQQTLELPAEAPATRPADDKVAKLIKDLGNEDFKVRDAACEELLKLGKEALPALKEALKNDDPCVKSYAEFLVPRIERKLAGNERVVRERPLPGGGVRGFAGGGRVSSVSVSINNGVKDITAKEGDLTVTIHEERDGAIKMTVSEPKDGKQVDTEYAAKNAEELKKNHPEAARLYEQYAGGVVGGGNVIIRGGGAMVGPGGGVWIQRGGAADFKKMREEQRARMEQMLRNMPEDHRERMLRGFDEAEQRHLKVLEDIEKMRQRMDQQMQQMDEMRIEVQGVIEGLPELKEAQPAPEK